MTDINLPRATRDSVATLRQAVQDAKTASLRIATGLRVNSAVEDPTAFFNSRQLSDQAEELNRALEQVSQGVRVVKAAHVGLQGISKLIDSAQSTVNLANGTDSKFDRAKYAANYNEILDQIEDMAKDSGYLGRNLLLGDGNDVKLYFGDRQTDAIEIEAVDYSDISRSLGLPRLQESKTAVFELPLTNGGTPLGPNDPLVSDSANFSVGDVVEIRDGGGAVIGSLTVTDKTTVSELINSLASETRGIRASLESGGVLRIEAAQDGTFSIGGSTVATLDATQSGWYDTASIDGSLEAVKDAQELIRLQAGTFGTNLTMLQSRENFMKQFSGVLLSGSEQILAADDNEEAANILSLQLRQQFAASALSFASEADQGILRLLGN